MINISILNRFVILGSNYKIISNIFHVGLFILVAKIIGGFKEIVIANKFGANAKVDAYSFLFNIYTWPGSISYAVIVAILVPIIVKSRLADTEGLSQFWQELFGLILVISIAISFPTLILLGFLIQTKIIGSTVENNTELMDNYIIMAPIMPITIICSLLSAKIISYGNKINNLLDGMPSFVIIVVLLCQPVGNENLLSKSSVYGVVAQFIALIMAVMYADNCIKLKFSFKSPYWREMPFPMLMMCGGQVLIGFTSIIDSFYGVNMNLGTLSLLGYSGRIISILLSLGAILISRSMLPIFSELACSHDRQDELAKVALFWIRVVLLFGVITSLVVYISSPTAVDLLFKHGNFSNSDALKVVEIIKLNVLCVPSYFAGIVAASFLTSMRFYNDLFLSGLLAALTKLFINYLLIDMLGIYVFPVGQIMMYIVSTIYMYSKIKKFESNYKKR